MSAKIPTEPSELIAFLRHETEERRNNTKWILICAWGGFAFLLALQILSWIRTGERPEFFAFTPALVLFGAASGMSGKHKLAAKHAAEISDPTFAPYMVEILDCGEEPIKALAVESLKRSLPHLQTEHRPLFDERQRKLLANEAMTHKDVDFVELTLHALAGIGGAENLPMLDQVATGKHVIKGEPAGRVVTAAKMAASDIRLRTAASVIQAAETSVEADLNTEQERLHLNN